jgi:tRNA-dihydrouridine synthase B
MQDEILVKDILTAVTSSVDVPVTLKMRTGWSRNNKNALTIAKIAQDAGIQMLSIHGRTKEDKYKGQIPPLFVQKAPIHLLLSQQFEY